LFVLNLPLSDSLAFLVLRGLFYDVGLQGRIGPDDHAEHPLDVGYGKVRETTRALSFCLQSPHQQIERVNGIPIPLLTLWDGVRLTTKHLEILAIGLD
jgi:hypothetical protein